MLAHVSAESFLGEVAYVQRPGLSGALHGVGAGGAVEPEGDLGRHDSLLKCSLPVGPGGGPSAGQDPGHHL